jgi:hypothetical protein
VGRRQVFQQDHTAKGKEKIERRYGKEKKKHLLLGCLMQTEKIFLLDEMRVGSLLVYSCIMSREESEESEKGGESEG